MVFSKIREKVGGWIAGKPERTQTTWDRLHKEAGFIPLLNETDTEARRAEVKEILKDSQNALFTPTLQKEIVQKVYALFFSAGNPWYRGLDNRELAEKVSYFLQNCTEVGYMEEFIPDLFEEAMQLLSLSWQALDVTNTPMYIIESRPVVIPKAGGLQGGDFENPELLQMMAEMQEKKKREAEEEG